MGKKYFFCYIYPLHYRTTTMINKQEIKDIEARQGFSFHDYQMETLLYLDSGFDVILSAPTGSGKTAIYQAASSLFRHNGVVLVVSPLRALIKDQMRRMKEQEIKACAFFGDVTGVQKRQNYIDLEAGEIDLVFVTAETLTRSKRLHKILYSIGVSLLVIDEAHVFEEWSNSFRPSYRGLGWIVDRCSVKRILACSATLSAYAAGEIASTLKRWNWEIVTVAAIRENLTYSGIKLYSNSLPRLISRVDKQIGFDSSKVVYFATVKSLMTAYEKIKKTNISGVSIYHGQMSRKSRKDYQDKWYNKGGWIFATKAFGMGIDKDNVRVVVHQHLPQSLIDYAQEAGRAGRDGEPSTCFLNENDNGYAAKFFIKNSYPTLQDLKVVYNAYKNQGAYANFVKLTGKELAQTTLLDERQAHVVRSWLVNRVITTRSADKNYYIKVKDDSWFHTDKRKALLKLMENNGYYIDGRTALTKQQFEEYVEPTVSSWYSMISQAGKQGALEVQTPEAGSYVKITSPMETFDYASVQRARRRAYKRLDNMIAFKSLASRQRPDAIKKEIELGQKTAMEEIKIRHQEFSKKHTKRQVIEQPTTDDPFF